MRKRYYLLLLVLALAPAGCWPDQQNVNRPDMPIVLLYNFGEDGDTLGWGITNEAVDSVHGFEINVELPWFGPYVNQYVNVWELTDMEHGLLELAPEGLRVPALTWYGLVPDDICRKTRRPLTVTGNMMVRAFRYYDRTGAFWGGDESVPWEGRWIGDQSDPLEDYTWRYNCTPNNTTPTG